MAPVYYVKKFFCGCGSGNLQYFLVRMGWGEGGRTRPCALQSACENNLNKHSCCENNLNKHSCTIC